jgi:hypothetical protein
MNEERDGLSILKDKIEEVAVEVETGRAGDSSSRRFRSILLAAAAVLVVALLGLQIMRKPRTTEVEVMELKIDGRPVGARIVEGAAPSTIIIVPERRDPVAAASAAGILGGTR